MTTDDTDSSLSSLSSSVFSSPLSSPANSPSPPPDEFLPILARQRALQNPYPSPPASQLTSQSGSPAPDGMDSSAAVDKDGLPPPKRRRISKERTTELLDLHSSEVDPDQQPQLDRLLEVLHKHQKIVVIAGAGISVSAGIPDFRSSQGLFQSLREEHKLKGSGKHLFDASVYRDDVSTSQFHEMVSSMSRLTKDAKPTAFHHMLATIAQEGRLLRLYSQNVDGIDTSLEPLKTCIPLRKEQGGKWPRTVQLHGGLDTMVCSKCHELSNLDANLFTGPIPPLCPVCEQLNDIRTTVGKRSHGIGKLRPRMVLYNEHNPDDEAIGAVTRDDLRKRPDAVIVVGTSLKVPGVRRIVREMCGVVRDRRGGVTVWINNDSPPVAKDLEDCWDIVVQGTSDEVANRAAMRKWDEPVLPDDFAEVTEEDANKPAEQTMEIQISACELKHAQVAPLPSAKHLNNSFRPPHPQETPKKPSEFGPTDWSPIKQPRLEIIPSIETNAVDDDNDDDTFNVVSSDTITVSAGLLTPTKSLRQTTERKPLTLLNEKTANPGLTEKPAATKIAKAAATGKPKKVSAAKPVKPTFTKPNAKSKPRPGNPITMSFKQSKTTVEKAKNLKGVSSKKAKSNMGSQQFAPGLPTGEPMHPVSPQDPRNNTLPELVMKDDTPLPELTQSENRPRDPKFSRMSVWSVLN